MLNSTVVGRLNNWKFRSAAAYAQEDTQTTEDELALIQALAGTFDNSGWFEGDLGLIVAAAVSTLVPEEDE
jgi:hypothetical protein